MGTLFSVKALHEIPQKIGMSGTLFTKNVLYFFCTFFFAVMAWRIHRSSRFGSNKDAVRTTTQSAKLDVLPSYRDADKKIERKIPS